MSRCCMHDELRGLPPAWAARPSACHARDDGDVSGRAQALAGFGLASLVYEYISCVIADEAVTYTDIPPRQPGGDTTAGSTSCTYAAVD